MLLYHQRLFRKLNEVSTSSLMKSECDLGRCLPISAITNYHKFSININLLSYGSVNQNSKNGSTRLGIPFGSSKKNPFPASPNI